ncbi:nicotinate-nucleotide adenylyltransferase [Insolitispirillum peregrinum]|uniref:nicotinate-nucleotide adenylyltransferase n=1 Tax=Insolitispirillum peregrinum TaxID=80876 RepID=UPI0036203A44
MPSLIRAHRTPSHWGGLQHGRIGLLGGSFNPAHDGHRHISLEALKRLGLDQVWWLVSPQNPLKSRAGMAALDQRVAKAQQVARHPAIRVTAIEQSLRSTYTVDTLAALQRRFPRLRFVWLMGADNMVQIPRWRRWQGIFYRVPVAIFDRGSYSVPAVTGLAARRFAAARLSHRRCGQLAMQEPPAWVYLVIRPHPASSTAIRAAGGWG